MRSRRKRMIRLLDHNTLPRFRYLMTDKAWDVCRGDDCLAVGALEETEDGLLPEGILIARARGGSLEIVFLYVDVPKRRKFIASFLLEFLLEAAGYDEDVFTLTATFPDDTGFGALKAFFVRHGFEISAGGILYETSLADLKDVGALLAPHAAADDSLTVSALADTPQYLVNAMNAALEQNQVDFVELPVRAGEYLPETVLCFAQNREFAGALLLRGGGAGNIELALLYISRAYASAIGRMISLACTRLTLHYPENTPLYFVAINDNAAKMAEKLLSGARKTPLCSALLSLPAEDEELIAYLTLVAALPQADGGQTEHE